MGFLQKVHSAVAKTKTSRFPVEKTNKAAAAALIHTKVVGSHTINVIYSKDAREFSNAHKKNFDSTRSSTETSLVEVVDAHEIEIIHLAEAVEDMTLEGDLTTKIPYFSLKRYKSDLVVVLDVDQCLVYYSENADNTENDTNKGTAGNPMWKLRPGLISFLKTTMTRYETHVFTAGVQFYAEPLLDVLSAVVGLPFAGRWYRAHCTQLSLTHFAKDLQATVMTGGGGDKDTTINMARTVAVDDNVDTFVVNPSNGIPIQQWTGEGDDRCLKSLTKLLEKLEKVPDVRPVLEKKFQLKDRYGGTGQINDFYERVCIYMRMKKYGLAA